MFHAYCRVGCPTAALLGGLGFFAAREVAAMAWSELDQQIANARISLRRAIRQLDYGRALRVMGQCAHLVRTVSSAARPPVILFLHAGNRRRVWVAQDDSGGRLSVARPIR